MAFSIPFKKIGKWALVLSFIAVISWVGYLVFDELFYHGRVKVTVIDKHTNKSYEFLYAPEPAQKGTYRLAVRLKSGESSNYTATISFR